MMNSLSELQTMKNLKTKTKKVSEQRKLEDLNEIDQFLYESACATVKAREIVEEYLDGNGEHERFER